MRVLAAGLRAILINGAGVVGLQKRARQLLEHPVVFFVESQVAGLKISCFETQALGYAILVALGPQRPRRLAAVGAGQAVRLGEHGLVKPVYHCVEVTRRLTL